MAHSAKTSLPAAENAPMVWSAWAIADGRLYVFGAKEGIPMFREQAPGIVAVTTREGDPPRVWSKAGATCMPLVKDIRKLMVATVLPAS